MKFLLVLPILVTASFALPGAPYVPPGWANLDTYDEFLEQVKEAYGETGSKTSEKIAGGTESKKGELPEFCYLNIGFYQKSQICGCFIYDSLHVITSARCVQEYVINLKIFSFFFKFYLIFIQLFRRRGYKRYRQFPSIIWQRCNFDHSKNLDSRR